jgi:hypothetical protein
MLARRVQEHITDDHAQHVEDEKNDAGNDQRWQAGDEAVHHVVGSVPKFRGARMHKTFSL